MTDIYLIRHGESEGNLYHRCQGWADGRLTPRGKAQAEALSRRLRDLPIAAVYASDLSRARDTARTALPRLSPTLLPGLREIHRGGWEDLSWGEILFRWPEDVARAETDPAFRVPGGESFSEAAARLSETLRRIGTRHDGTAVAAVSHGAVLRAFLHAEAGLPFDASWGNTALGLVRFQDGVFSPVFAADASHAAGLGSPPAGRRPDGSWTELRFRTAESRSDDDFALAARSETWTALYGQPSGFDTSVWASERRAARRDRPPWALQIALDGQAPAGVLELQPSGGERSGHISFFYLSPSYRGRNLAPQLLGEAVSRFRADGRTRLTLRVSPGNGRALRCYEKAGFVRTGTSDGAHGPLLVLSLDL